MAAHAPGLNMSITSPALLKRALAAPLYIAIAWSAGAAHSQTLTVANFGGANASAQQLAFYTPFEAATKGAKVRGVEYTGDLAQVAAMVKRGKPEWDVVEVESADLTAGCTAGLFERIDRAAIPHTSMLLPGTVQECGLGAFVWSTVLAYDTQRFGKEGPKSWADFWDVQRFPGKRGLRKGVRYNLEIALLADGVHRRDVYSQLASEAGMARALKKLEQLKPHIVWWESGAQAPQKLLDGTVSMTTAFNGRVAAANAAGAPGRLSIVWADAIYEMDYWAIVRGTPQQALALDFLRFTTSEKAQLAFSQAIPYGPTHMGAILRYEQNRPRSAEPGGAGSHNPLIDLSMAPSDLPSAPANLRKALGFDAGFWRIHGPALERRWSGSAP
jgi:putative spermidine/putrescine transport system substrate-binding protein